MYSHYIPLNFEIKIYVADSIMPADELEPRYCQVIFYVWNRMIKD